MRIPFSLTILALALANSGCGPTDEEAARVVLFVAPLVHFVSLGVLWGLFHLWRKVHPELVMDLRPALIALGVLVVGGVLSLVGVTQDPNPDGLSDTTNGVAGVLEWFELALPLFGASFLALLLVIWRIWLRLAPRTAFGWSFLPVAVFMLWPCPIMAIGVTETWQDVFGPVWSFPGYMGFVTGPLLLIAVVEVLLRIRKKRRLQP